MNAEPRRNEVAITSSTDPEVLRLRAWLTVLADVEGDSTLTIKFARKIRYIARRALQGDEI